MVHYLFKNSSGFEQKKIPVSGNAARGQSLVASLGCYGCHRLEAEPTVRETTLQTLRRDHGPNLIGLGSKTTKAWIYNWLKEPERYFPETKMPNLRLTDQEAADITEFLWSKKQKEFMNTTIPELDENVLDNIVTGFEMKLNTEAAAREMAAGMTLEEKLDYSGERLIRLYGCFGCHNIPGFEDEKPIGTELTYEGDKPVDKLDFGLLDIEHKNYVWFETKLKSPRIFDRGKIKPHDEKLRMPNFDFTRSETEAIVTALLGFVKPEVLPGKIKPRSARNEYVEEGQWIIREYNCQGCHIIEGDGGAIQPMVTEWLKDSQNRGDAEAEALTSIFSPPNLIGEGKKVQTEWLFHFIREPEIIRPWLKTRMPTFSFSESQVNVLIRYFSYLDHQDFPFTDKLEPEMTREELQAAETLFSKDYFSCRSCHIVGSQMPEGSPENWAPNFALAKDRLKPDWIVEWMKDPQTLLPGTKMPTFYDPLYFENSGPDDVLDGDENEQIRVLRDYIYTIK
jgi:cytochrome c2